MAAVDYLAEQIAGAGFYTVFDPGHEEAKRAVGGFCDDVNMDGLHMQIAKEVVFSGNSYMEKIRSTKNEDQGRLVQL